MPKMQNLDLPSGTVSDWQGSLSTETLKDFVIEPYYIKLREMQDVLNASVGYGINTHEELKKKEEQKRIRKNIGWGLVYD